MPNNEKGISNKGYSLIRAYHQIMQNEKESVFVIKESLGICLVDILNPAEPDLFQVTVIDKTGFYHVLKQILASDLI